MRNEGLALGSTLTTVRVPGSVLLSPGPRPVAGGSSVGVMAREWKSVVTTGACFVVLNTGAEDWGECTRGGLIYVTAAYGLSESRVWK